MHVLMRRKSLCVICMLERLLVNVPGRQRASGTAARQVASMWCVQGQAALGDEKISLLVTTALKHGIAQAEGFLRPAASNRRSQQGFRERLGNIMNGISPSNTELRDELRDKIQSFSQTQRGGTNRTPAGAQSTPISPALSSVVGDSIQLGLQRTVNVGQRATQVVREQFQR